MLGYFVKTAPPTGCHRYAQRTTCGPRPGGGGMKRFIRRYWDSSCLRSSLPRGGGLTLARYWFLSYRASSRSGQRFRRRPGVERPTGPASHTASAGTTPVACSWGATCVSTSGRSSSCFGTRIGRESSRVACGRFRQRGLPRWRAPWASSRRWLRHWLGSKHAAPCDHANVCSLGLPSWRP